MSRENLPKDTVDTVKENAAKGLHQAASAIHDRAGKIRNSRTSDAAHMVAQGIDSTATYVENHDLSDMGEDVMNVCRKYPVQAILTSLTVGFLLGRAIR